MRGFVKFLLWAAGIAGAIGLVAYLAIFDVWVVPSDDPLLAPAVEPTLSVGDTLLVLRRSTPTFGSLVRCDDPDAPGRFVVGRIVGTANDVVDLKAEQLDVNGRHEPSIGPCDPQTVTLKDPHTQEDVALTCRRYEMAGVSLEYLQSPSPSRSERDVHAVVEPGKVYLLSDNRRFHLDSREFGQVKTTTCQHVVYRLWSAAGVSYAGRRFNVLW